MAFNASSRPRAARRPPGPDETGQGVIPAPTPANAQASQPAPDQDPADVRAKEAGQGVIVTPTPPVGKRPPRR